ncbi:hypothetical protein [Candidatus Albibeggiatoa sp. nov. NOAA]|uniref:hypothetical protein n=1 Tax=Candidatus Albibeggiatoa sp. nov. NOAA TaxID=3162724 RepID=UPI0032F6FC91|nr:hypothetical protein [Thiotrichaceae bacterium]
MLEYYKLIHDLYRQSPIQQMFYASENNPIHFETRIRQDKLQFEYQLIDIYEMESWSNKLLEVNRSEDLFTE